MQRQKSILSFLRKPESSSSGKPIVLDASDEEIKGTDTPPEKVPRRVFADSRPSLFSSIRHKFEKVDNVKNSESRCEEDNTRTVRSLPLQSDGPEDPSNLYLVPKQHNKQSLLNNSRTKSSERDSRCSFLTTFEDDVLGPDTPGTRPLVPRLKRVQEDICNFKDKADFSLPDNKKRTKFLQDSNVLMKNGEDDSETISKFEWLHPSRIKDANGRKLMDPLYDKRTLYIPPDALRKMSASQRQYWNVKCKYMDVVLFFKVVGVSESGIDDAVQKLIARGYKVGRMEQLETSEQAKSRGSTSDALLKNGSISFGFAFVDCAALKFWIGSISDDASCAALGALLMQSVVFTHVTFSLLLEHGTEYYVGRISRHVQFIFCGSTPSQLNPCDTFGEALEVRNIIDSNRYFSGSSDSWHHIRDGAMLGDLELCALGGLISHLSRLMLNDVIRNGDILSYEVYKGTLYKYLNNCITSSGKRLLRNWICHPLQDVEKINNRLAVVEELMANPEIMLLIAQSLRKLPDLERLLGRVKSSFQSSSVILLP
ncbi:UNVERIFIED_CONTAM: DNA mismatch repair protein MSH7 [Sesamum latifolium]|uniref:DNA mismatch repair protein MSH7 n=1 Tax=Sesamum latifolium TaxID=2727402 RepID=A0AAW2VFZ8_9LAMI